MRRVFLALAACAIAVASTSGRAETPADAPSTPPAASPAEPTRDAPQAEIRGRVIETKSVVNYTYLQILTDRGALWVAAPLTGVNVGDTVVVSGALPMPNFYSSTLEREFDLIYFTQTLQIEGAEPGKASEFVHPSPESAAGDGDVEVSGIERALGGKTIRELFEDKEKLAGQEIVLRGKVVKYTRGVMGRNWIHLKDGTQSETGGDEITVTTSDETEVGQTLVVRGTLATDKDFGYGYKYEILIEDARVTGEK